MKTHYISKLLLSLFFILPVIATAVNDHNRYDQSYKLPAVLAESAADVSFIYNGEEVTYGIVEYAGQIWLDRNLGADQVANAYNDPESYGHYFQWGREADGHQLPDSEILIDEFAPSGEQPGHDHFIRVIPANYPENDWNADNEWLHRWTDDDENKTNADPCPPGWRVPNVDQWQAAIDEEGWTNREDAYASPLKISATGIRQNNAAFNQVDLVGYYAATPAEYDPTRPRWEGGRFTTGATTAVTGSNYMAGGMVVRCIRIGIEPHLPSVETNEVTQILSSEALVAAMVLYDGGSEVIDRGVYYGQQDDPEISGTQISEGDGIGSYTLMLEELDVATTYYVKAYAENEHGVAHGETLSFTTAEDTFIIEATAGDNGMIDPSGDVAVGLGEDQIFTIQADEGYHTADVLVDEQSMGTLTEYVFENVTQNHSIHASFQINTYTLSYLAGDNGSIAGDANQEVEHGSDGDPVEAIPNEGYSFFRWSDGITDNPRTDYNITANVEVTAEFIDETPNVSFVYNGEVVNYGTVEHAGFFWMDRNLGASHAAESYDDSDAYGHLFQWGREDDGHQIRTSASTHVLAAPGEQPGHNEFITLSENPYDWNEDNTWTTRWLDEDDNNAPADPCPPGWQVPSIDHWQIALDEGGWNSAQDAFESVLRLPLTQQRSHNGNIINDNLGEYTSSTWMDPEHNSGRLHTYRLRTHSVENYAVINHTIINVGMAIRCVFSGENIEETPSVKTSYVDQILTTSAVVIAMVSYDGGAEVIDRGVYFGQQDDPEISGTKVSEGTGLGGFSLMLEDLELSATYYVQAYAVNEHGEGLGETLSFTTAEDIFIIEATAGDNGMIDPSGDVAVGLGEDIAFNIEADEGYHISEVLVDEQNVGAVAEYVFENVSQNHSIHASFQINTYTLSYLAGDNGSIAGDATQQVEYGSDGEPVEAIPDEGYRFLDWSDGVTDNPRTDYNVTEDIEVAAEFVPETPGITFIYNGEEVTYGTIEYAGFLWLDRNLGADQVANAYNDPESYGHYFQWGREADGHQLPDSEVLVDEYAPAGEQPGHDLFIRVIPANYPENDWNTDNEWLTRWTDEDGNKTDADPCPPGWHVPHADQWQAAIDEEGWTNIEDAFDSPLRIPATGIRQNNAVFNQVGDVGYYAATPAEYDPERPRWEGGRFTTGATTAVLGSNYMAGGMSIRCISYDPETKASSLDTPEPAVFPNPVNTTLNVMTAMPAEEIHLVNMSGTVFQITGFSTQDNKVQFDVSHLPDGLYVVRVVANQEVFTTRVVIAR